MHQRPVALNRNGFRGIAAALREQIEAGTIAAGRYLPTERELQQEFGASRSTIRRALAMLVESGCASNVPSKGVVAGPPALGKRTRNIALIDGSSFVLKVLLLRLGDMLRDSGYHLVHLGAGTEFSMEEALQYAEASAYAGALVWPYRGFPDEAALKTIGNRLPIVSLDHAVRGIETDLISYDYFAAGVLATSHLIRQGRRRIAITGMFDMLQENHDRFSGYLKALFDHDLNPDSRDFLFSMTSGMACHDAHLLEMRLREADRPDALFVMQDDAVPSVLEAILNAGLSVPDDIAIVTIGDDIEVQVDGRALTAVVLDWETFALEATNALIERINNPHHPKVALRAPHRLAVRGLCGAPREEWTSPEDLKTVFRETLPAQRSRYQFSSVGLSSSLDRQDSMRRQHATMKRAFTLIELLVVIAIIAILAAILFPVFAQAKAAAKKTSSLSNIKQNALGVMMYNTDHDDMYDTGSGICWFYPTDGGWAWDVYPYLKSYTILLDATDTKSQRNWRTWMLPPNNPTVSISYASNGYLWQDQLNGWKTYMYGVMGSGQGPEAAVNRCGSSPWMQKSYTNESSVTQPASTIMLAARFSGQDLWGLGDVFSCVSWWDNGYEPAQIPDGSRDGSKAYTATDQNGTTYTVNADQRLGAVSAPYSNQAPFAFCDGHAKTMNPAQTNPNPHKTNPTAPDPSLYPSGHDTQNMWDAIR